MRTDRPQSNGKGAGNGNTQNPSRTRATREALAELADCLGEIALCAPLGLRDRTQPAVARVVAILGQLFGAAPPSTKERRGRRRSHDREFALGCLVEIVGTDPDGLALSQAALVRRLARRFDDAGKSVPGVTWLKETVAEFGRRSLIREQSAREKWRGSSDLQATFETADDFVSFCRTRDRLEEKWWKDRRLQKRFASAGVFVADTLATNGDSSVEASGTCGHKG